MSVPVMCTLVPELTREGCRMCGFGVAGLERGAERGRREGPLCGGRDRARCRARSALLATALLMPCCPPVRPASSVCVCVWMMHMHV